jgi:hypothetical protein
MANDLDGSKMVKNGVPQGQILKLQKSYRVVSQIKGLDEFSSDQLTILRL